MSALHMKSSASYKQAIAANKLVVVDFSTSWCGPCNAIAPKFAEFAAKYQQAAFLKVKFLISDVF